MQSTSPPCEATILVVDDDAELRAALASLFRGHGFQVRSFASAGEFLASPLPDGERCLVTDIRMPGMNGLELAAALSGQGQSIPIIFLTGHADVPLTVRAMKTGAIDLIAKPFDDAHLLDAVNTALTLDRQRIEASRLEQPMLERYARLTRRERQVMNGVVRGLLNKQIAWELEISEITVKLHRSSVMRKLELRSVPDLVRTALVVEGPIAP